MNNIELFDENGKFKKGHPVPDSWKDAVILAHKGKRWTPEFFG